MKPMLAGKYNPLKASWPVLGSPKLDGVRALVIGGRLMSRSLKSIPNAWCQRVFSNLAEGTDGELIFGDPTHPDAYRNTVSAVMSEDGEPTKVRFHIFDNFLVDGGFQSRHATLHNHNKFVVVVPHKLIRNSEELTEYEEMHVEGGYEGVMIRKPDGHYKQGRSTENDGLLLKVKQFEDAEAEVVSVYEWQTNNNAARTNALGRTERSSHQGNKVGAGVLGGLNVVGLQDPYKGVEFSIGTGFTGADDPNGERGKLWQERGSLVGKIAKFKYFPTGGKDRPRFPVFLGWRDAIDK